MGIFTAALFCFLLQLNFIGHPYGLSKEETKELWVQADPDGNGVVDYKEFQVGTEFGLCEAVILIYK